MKKPKKRQRSFVLFRDTTHYGLDLATLGVANERISPAEFKAFFPGIKLRKGEEVDVKVSAKVVGKPRRWINVT